MSAVAKKTVVQFAPKRGTIIFSVRNLGCSADALQRRARRYAEESGHQVVVTEHRRDTIKVTLSGKAIAMLVTEARQRASGQDYMPAGLAMAAETVRPAWMDLAREVSEQVLGRTVGR